MSDALAARRYAEGLGAVIEDDDGLQPALDALHEFVDAYRQNDGLRVVLENPALNASVRASVLDAVLEAMNLPGVPASFLRTLFARRRIRLVAAAVEEFARICDTRLNRETAEIVTAAPLREDQAEQVLHAIATFADKSITATRRVDPGIIGGIVVRVGGFVIDRSIRRELDRVESELLDRE
jgi:F-type H+-transporting ATPase subunit delta